MLANQSNVLANEVVVVEDLGAMLVTQVTIVLRGINQKLYSLVEGDFEIIPMVDSDGEFLGNQFIALIGDDGKVIVKEFSDGEINRDANGNSVFTAIIQDELKGNSHEVEEQVKELINWYKSCTLVPFNLTYVDVPDNAVIDELGGTWDLATFTVFAEFKHKDVAFDSTLEDACL